MIFSAPLLDKLLKFLVKISLNDEHPLDNHLVRLSVIKIYATYRRTRPCHPEYNKEHFLNLLKFPILFGGGWPNIEPRPQLIFFVYFS